MRERQRYKLPSPVHVEPGDRLVCSIDDRKTKTRHQFQEKIGRSQIVDTIVTFDVDEPVLGLVNGFGAIFGNSGQAEKP